MFYKNVLISQFKKDSEIKYVVLFQNTFPFLKEVIRQLDYGSRQCFQDLGVERRVKVLGSIRVY